MKQETIVINLDNNDPTLHTAMCLPYPIDSFRLEVKYWYSPKEAMTMDYPGCPESAEVESWEVESFETNGIDVVPSKEQQKYLQAEIDVPTDFLEQLILEKREADDISERAASFYLETRGEWR